MNTFSTNNFIKSVKDRYDAIPYIQGMNSAKKMVADTIKSNNFSPEDVMAYLCKTAGLSSTITDAEWQAIFNNAIQGGNPVAKNLAVYQSALKGKLSYEEMFNLAASVCGKNPTSLCNELRIDQYGWQKVVESIVKSATKEKKSGTKKTASKEEKPTIPVQADPRNKSITLINKETGEVKTWPSYKACEVELFDDPQKGHGTASQIVSGKVKSIKGVWMLYKPESSAPAKAEKGKQVHPRVRPIKQFVVYKDGSKVEVRTFSSITEAAKETGIKHTSICKCANGTKGYATAGGFSWGYADV